MTKMMTAKIKNKEISTNNLKILAQIYEQNDDK